MKNLPNGYIYLFLMYYRWSHYSITSKGLLDVAIEVELYSII